VFIGLLKLIIDIYSPLNLQEHAVSPGELKCHGRLFSNIPELCLYELEHIYSVIIVLLAEQLERLLDCEDLSEEKC